MRYIRSYILFGWIENIQSTLVAQPVQEAQVKLFMRSTPFYDYCKLLKWILHKQELFIETWMDNFAIQTNGKLMDQVGTTQFSLEKLIQLQSPAENNFQQIVNFSFALLHGKDMETNPQIIFVFKAKFFECFILCSLQT